MEDRGSDDREPPRPRPHQRQARCLGAARRSRRRRLRRGRLPGSRAVHRAPTGTTGTTPAATGPTGTPAPTSPLPAEPRSTPPTPAPIEIDTTQGWAGPQLVKVTTGAGSLTTWYAHMREGHRQPRRDSAARPADRPGRPGRQRDRLPPALRGPPQERLDLRTRQRRPLARGSPRTRPGPTRAGVIAPDSCRDIGDQPATTHGELRWTADAA